MLNIERAALIPIDIQRGFDDPNWGSRNNPSLPDNVKKLFKAWRENGKDIFHVQHLSSKVDSPLHPSSPGVQFMEFAKPLPGEIIIQKKVHSAFIGTHLEAQLRNKGIKSIILAGITTDHCVSTTARMGANLGFDVYVVSDATATFNRTGLKGSEYPADLVHDITLASLSGQFATIVTTEAIISPSASED